METVTAFEAVRVLIKDFYQNNNKATTASVFSPQTYFVSTSQTVLYQMKRSPGSIWIVKPPGEMCGNGIRLVMDPKVNKVLNPNFQSKATLKIALSMCPSVHLFGH